jgi:hypothetical protein
MRKKRDRQENEVWATTAMRFLMENSMVLIITIDG